LKVYRAKLFSEQMLTM